MESEIDDDENNNKQADYSQEFEDIVDLFQDKLQKATKTPDLHANKNSLSHTSNCAAARHDATND